MIVIFMLSDSYELRMYNEQKDSYDTEPSTGSVMFLSVDKRETKKDKGGVRRQQVCYIFLLLGFRTLVYRRLVDDFCYPAQSQL